MHPNSRGLAFLLSIGGLPLGCSKNDHGDSTVDPTTEGTGGPGVTTTGTTGTTATSDTGATPTTGAPGTSTDAPTTTSAATGTATEDTGDTGDPPPAADPSCLAFGKHYVECYPRYAMFEDAAIVYCQGAIDDGLRAYGQACADAFDAYYVCLSMVDCADFGSDEVCVEQDAAVEGACASESSESSPDSSDG